MRQFLNKLVQWFNDVFHLANIRATLDAAITELEMLRAAVVDFEEQKAQFEDRITKYKKQIKELKAELKDLKSGEQD